jgi:hypothetical protein
VLKINITLKTLRYISLYFLDISSTSKTGKKIRTAGPSSKGKVEAAQ